MTDELQQTGHNKKNTCKNKTIQKKKKQTANTEGKKKKVRLGSKSVLGGHFSKESLAFECTAADAVLERALHTTRTCSVA